MKAKIHPKYYPEARVICSCGHTFTTGATVPEIRTDVCSSCHPFFTGEQRIVDTAGQVERFMRRLEQRSDKQASGKQRRKTARRKKIVESVSPEEKEAEVLQQAIATPKDLPKASSLTDGGRSKS